MRNDTPGTDRINDVREAAKQHVAAYRFDDPVLLDHLQASFIAGARWQQEREIERLSNICDSIPPNAGA